MQHRLAKRLGDALRTEWKERARWLPYAVFLASLLYVGALMPAKPVSDMSHFVATAQTMVASGFAEGYVETSKRTRDVRFTRIGGRTYTVYPKALELVLAVPILVGTRAHGAWIVAGSLLIIAIVAWRGRRLIPAISLIAALLMLVLFASLEHVVYSASSADISVVLFHGVLGALTMVMGYQLFVALDIPERQALALILAVCVGSFWGYYYKPYTREVYYVLPIIASLNYTVRRRFLAAAVWLGLAMVSKYLHAALALPGLLFYVGLLAWNGELHRRQATRAVMLLVAIPLLGLAANKLANVFYIGRMDAIESLFYLRPFDAWVVAKELFTALVGLTVSSGKGIIFFFPLSLLLMRMSLKGVSRRAELSLLVLLILPLVGFYVAFPLVGGHWSGDLAWGPRYLLQITIPIAAIVGLSVPALKTRTIVVFALVGLCVNLPGTLFAPHASYKLTLAQERVEKEGVRFEPWRNPTLASVYLLGEWIAGTKTPPTKLEKRTFARLTDDIGLRERSVIMRSYVRDPFSHHYYLTEQARGPGRQALVKALSNIGFFKYHPRLDGLLWRLIL